MSSQGNGPPHKGKMFQKSPVKKIGKLTPVTTPPIPPRKPE